MSREERKKYKKEQKELAIAKKRDAAIEPGDMPSEPEEASDDDDMPANPNHTKAARSQAQAQPGENNDVEEVTEGVKKLATTRNPVQGKEQLRAQEAQAKDAAKVATDLERLAEVRRDREERKAIRQVCRTVLYCSFLECHRGMLTKPI